MRETLVFREKFVSFMRNLILARLCVNLDFGQIYASIKGQTYFLIKLKSLASLCVKSGEVMVILTVKIISDALNAYIRFVLDHRISKENIVHVLAAGRIRKRLQIDPNGQQYFEDIELGSNEVEDLKKAFAAFIASAQDIFCSRQKEVIRELSTVIESFSTV
jgi:hypothetical protein